MFRFEIKLEAAVAHLLLYDAVAKKRAAGTKMGAAYIPRLDKPDNMESQEDCVGGESCL